MLSTRRDAPFPRGLYAVCDDSVRPELPLEDKAARLLDGGARVIQLRLKRTPMRDAVGVARSLNALCRERGAVLLINDRVDLCLLSGAHGVHLGDEDLPVPEARGLLPKDAIVGATVRDLEGARRAVAEGADYAGIGPVFLTTTKTVNAAPLGLDGLREIAAQSPLPLVAISGITLGNIAEVAATGVHNAAVISDALCAEDIAQRASALQQAFLAGASGKVGGTR